MAKLTRTIIPAMLLIGLASFVHACSKSDAPNDAKIDLASLAVGEMTFIKVLDEVPPQPSEPILGPDDQEVRLADFNEKIVVVNFWGTFCAPCVAEMPTLAELQETYADKMKVVAITADNRQDLEKARTDLAKLSNDRLDFFYDPKRGIIYDSMVGGFPTTIVYGTDGQEILRLEGEADWVAPESLALFDAIIENEGLNG